MGVHRGINRREPYVVQEDVTFGGTAFFINAIHLFGWEHAVKPGAKIPTEHRLHGVNVLLQTRARGRKVKHNLRFALTNFHVVDEVADKTCLLP